MKHIIIFLAYKNVDIIQKSFESLSLYKNADFFIVENFSENSNEISKYFFKKNLKGYIQFEENAAANAINVFIKNYYTLLEKYDFITFTDGDIICYDINDTFREILKNLNQDNAVISSCDLWLGNLYTNKIKQGLDDYYKIMPTIIETKYDKGHTGNTLVTLKNEYLYLLKDIHYTDTLINQKIKTVKGIWYKTTKNLAYHLTWDLYVDGNEYYEWKKNVYPSIWDKIEKNFKFNVYK